MARGKNVRVQLTQESYWNILNAAGVREGLYRLADELCAELNSTLHKPQEGELYITRHSDSFKRARATIMPANARTMAHDNKHHSLLKFAMRKGRST